jgi:hypothetical protein
MKLTQDQFDALLEYINCAIKDQLPGKGLIESIRLGQARRELENQILESETP